MADVQELAMEPPEQPQDWPGQATSSRALRVFSRPSDGAVHVNTALKVRAEQEGPIPGGEVAADERRLAPNCSRPKARTLGLYL